MKAKRKRRMSRRRRELTYIAVMVLLAIAVSIGLTHSVMRDDKKFEEYEQQSQEFNARMQRIDEKRETSGQNAMLEQVRTWQQDTEPDKYAVFDTMSADWGGEEDGFVLYEIPEEYSRTGGYFPEKMQVYTYCVCKQYGVRYDLVVALIEKESGYKFDKVGDDGHSIGYMQIYEECHRDRMERLNVTDLTNPYQNVLVGIDYLSELIERYGTIQDALEDDVPDIYDVTQPSVLACIGEKGIRRATVIKDCAYTITTRQDRTPAQVIDRGDGRYRYLTERECWRLMGYSDEDFDRAKAVQERNGKYYKALYDQAGNSIAVPIFESIFRKIILQEVA